MSVMPFAYFTAIEAGVIAATLADWHRHSPGMGVIAFLPESERDHLSVVQALFQQSDIPLVGAIFPAILVDGHFHSDGILLYRFEHMPNYILREGLAREGEALAETTAILATDIEQHLEGEDGTTSLFLLFDAMLPHIGQILEELYLQLADQVHYMGINAGSESFQPMPCLFDTQRVIQEGVLALLLPDNPGAVLEHGYQVPEQLIAATSTDGNRIISIDWRPAFEVYAERVKAQYGVAITADNFYQYAVHFPFGIIRADSEVLVRIPVALMEDGSLFCVGEIPPNAILTLLEAPSAESVHTIELLAEHFSPPANHSPPVTFYCAGRRQHLGLEAAHNELQALSARLGNAQLYGALSLGEIGSSRRGGYPLFHNATLVLTRL